MTSKPSNKPSRNNQKHVYHKPNVNILKRLVIQPNNMKNKVLLKSCDKQKKVTTNLLTFGKEKDSKLSTNIGGKKKVGLMEKLQHLKDAEFYPDLSKRNVQTKKVKLQPKHDYLVVATTNKRKRGIPHRGVDFIEHTVLEPLSESPALHHSLEPLGMEELSLSSLVRLAEDQGLNDEDFMEILTCPSPVWWEETSSGEDEDESFNEKTIGHQNTHETYTTTTTDANGNKISIANKSKCDLGLKKFATKRSKLENILGNIKCKNISKSANVIDKRNTGNEQNMNDISGDNNNIQQDINYINDFEENTGFNEENVNDSDESVMNNTIQTRARKRSLGEISDASINEDLLNTLESIEIPVKVNNKRNVKNKSTNEIVMMEILNKPVQNHEINVNNKRKRTRKQKKNDDLQLEEQIKTVKRKNKLDSHCTVPPDLPPLTKNPFKTTRKSFESPKSIESVNSESNAIELDSISDTNIKFLDEYVDTKKEHSEGVSVKKYGKGLDGELITVYQIISNKTDYMDLDIEQQIKVNLVNKSPQTDTNNKNNSEINSFFKTRKSAYRSRSKYKKK